MNERAREALVAAALSGRSQIKRRMHDEFGGACAAGVLFENVTGERHQAFTQYKEFRKVLEELDISERELTRIWHANDIHGWDFLTIARKIGNDDADAD
jgi:hypothetical protein